MYFLRKTSPRRRKRPGILQKMRMSDSKMSTSRDPTSSGKTGRGESPERLAHQKQRRNRNSCSTTTRDLGHSSARRALLCWTKRQHRGVGSKGISYCTRAPQRVGTLDGSVRKPDRRPTGGHLGRSTLDHVKDSGEQSQWRGYRYQAVTMIAGG